MGAYQIIEIKKMSNCFMTKFGVWFSLGIKFPEVLLRCIPVPSCTIGGR